MNALSRREEDTLLKTTKTRALKECDVLVKGLPFFKSTHNRCLIPGMQPDMVVDFAECATGRTVSVAWACKTKYKEVQDCMLQLYVSVFLSLRFGNSHQSGLKYWPRSHGDCSQRIFTPEETG